MIYLLVYGQNGRNSRKDKDLSALVNWVSTRAY